MRQSLSHLSHYTSSMHSLNHKALVSGQSGPGDSLRSIDGVYKWWRDGRLSPPTQYLHQAQTILCVFRISANRSRFMCFNSTNDDDLSLPLKSGA